MKKNALRAVRRTKKKRARPAGPGAAQARANGRRAKRPPSRTLLEYLDWRGDLTFSADPPNEVDSLIFCWLAYLDLDCAARPWQQALPLPEAAEWYKTSGAAARFDQRRMSYSAVELLQKAAQCARFQNVRVWGFTRRTDGERAEQFAAVSFGVMPGLAYTAFRGTDNTLLGWREDFNMSFMEEVPAQRDAAGYLRRIAGEFDGSLQVGGHSKGGNLAVYAAVRQEPAVRARIQAVFNNDGPGFRAEMLTDPGYVELLPRIRTVVPQSSVIGMLLEHSEEYTVVKSDAIWAVQHDAMSWQVLGGRFVRLQSVTPNSQLTDRSLKKWLEDKDPKSRALFVDTLFTVVDSTGAKTLSELTEKGMRSALAMLRSVKGLDRETRRQVFYMLKSLLRIGLSMWAEQSSIPLSSRIARMAAEKKSGENRPRAEE